MSTKSSSLSARRHLNFVEHPYVGKIFYIDIKTASIRTKVVQRIQTLGGQIESFLSKDISVFITDRHEKRGDSPDESLERHSRINKCVPLSRGMDSAKNTFCRSPFTTFIYISFRVPDLNYITNFISFKKIRDIISFSAFDWLI